MLKQTNKTKQLVFSAIAIALATITSFLKIANLPYGGSITLFSMLFVCLIGYWYGVRWGITAGIAYGLLQLVLGPYIVHPIQLLLDYPIAFGALGLSGVFRTKKFGLCYGYLLGVFGRYIIHSISGYIFFSSYAPVGKSLVFYTLSYNATYILPEAIITLMLIFATVMVGALNRVNKIAME